MRRAEYAVALAEQELPVPRQDLVEDRAVEIMAQMEQEAPVVMTKQLKEDEEGGLVVADKELAESISVAVERSVECVCEVIALTLKSKELGKFAEAARLCNIGQSLMRTRAKRIQDFRVLDDGVDEGMQMQEARYHPRGDAREVERNHMLTFGPLAQLNAENQRATIATQEAAEFQSLTAIRDTVPEAQRAPIMARIAVLLEHMEARNAATRPPNPDAGDDPEPGVADPVVPRGHPLGDGGQDRDDGPPRLPAHGLGGEGNGVVAHACRIDEAAQEMGVGG